MLTDEFKRENRYIVFKLSDLGNSLKGDDIRTLAREYAEHRKMKEKPPLECVIVESDWPEYETVWKMIEDRMTGRAIETEVAAQAGQEPVAFVYNTGYMDQLAVKFIVGQTAPEGAILYAAPVACPKCDTAKGNLRKLSVEFEKVCNERDSFQQKSDDTYSDASGIIQRLMKERDALQAKVAELEALSVTNIMTAIVPGDDGMGEEVYAKSISDVEHAMTVISEGKEYLSSKVAEQRVEIERLNALIASVRSNNEALHHARDLLRSEVNARDTTITQQVKRIAELEQQLEKEQSCRNPELIDTIQSQQEMLAEQAVLIGEYRQSERFKEEGG